MGIHPSQSTYFQFDTWQAIQMGLSEEYHMEGFVGVGTVSLPLLGPDTQDNGSYPPSLPQL